MAALQERRNSSRTEHDDAFFSILHADGVACNFPNCGRDVLYVFVDVHNVSDNGALLTLPFQLPAGTVFNLSAAGAQAAEWVTRQARVVWTCKNDDGFYKIGVSVIDAENSCPDVLQRETDPLRPSPEDLSFLVGASLFQALSEKGLCLLLNALRKTPVKAGDRVIAQGGLGDCLYLIQQGRCVVSMHQDGQDNRIVSLDAGDVFGEMAVLTDGPRTANVDAETDAVLWRLERRDFEALAQSNPDLRLFLTEIMTRRFDDSIFVGDRTIGKYVLNSKIGTGGWGIVYRGVHKILKLSVAVKMMKHDMAMEKAFLETFRKEAEIIARMSHPNIVSVYDIEEAYRTVFIIMEYLDGNSLKEHIKKTGRLPAQRCANILAQVCDGLACAHALDIIHRDIKPANIFLLENDRVKLLDFGLACAPGTEDLNIRGTVYYAPPEQIDGWPVGAGSDIYSMGVMAYEMATGSKPYPGKSLAEIMELHCSQDIPDPALIVPDIPGALREFIMTCGRRDPEARFASANGAREALAPMLSAPHRPGNAPQEPERSVTSVVLIHTPEQQHSVKRLLEEFGGKASEIGINMLMSEFRHVS